MISWLRVGKPEVHAHNRENTLSGNDWHASRNDEEPRCGADQWRTRNRFKVMYMHEMDNKHLGHCIRFASTKSQHASRLTGLLNERHRRATGKEVEQ